MSAFSAGLDGFVLGAGLIIAIGAQNAFVLRQGLKRAWRVLDIGIGIVMWEIAARLAVSLISPA